MRNPVFGVLRKRSNSTANGDNMFIYEGGIWKSNFINHPEVRHAFPTRLGGVSVNSHTKSMNIGFNRGDDDGAVKRNIEILCEKAGLSYDGICASPQYHTSHVRYVTEENRHEGIETDNTDPSDGFVTDGKGVCVLVRTADCVPILFQGEKEDGSPVVGAVHAGWRGTVSGIVSNCIEKMKSLGATGSSFKVAIGPCIGQCCFEVKEDFVDAVISAKGTGFAKRHIEKRENSFFANLISMNAEILAECGIFENRTDTLRECTACKPYLYHSHRATGGKRGTLGAVIGIL